MSDKHIYTTGVTWNEGRTGTLASGEFEKIKVATPPEFPKGVEGLWSPEHLFVAAAEVCLMTTFLAIAENSKLNFTSYKSTAEGTLEKVEGKFVISTIVIKPEVVVESEGDIERAERILEKSEKHCLISNSMTSDVKLETSVTVAK